MAQHTRSEILKAAGRVVAEKGAKHLTLEAVATEAGVSKGGLLYHFASKEALISALIRDLVDQFDSVFSTFSKTGRGTNTLAYVQATFSEAALPLDRAAAGVLSALANDPTLLEPLREAYERWHGEMNRDHLDPVTIAILRLATDGLWFSKILGIDQLPPEMQTKVIDRLKFLAVGDQPIQ